ncbi:hypothetical protein [Paracraurococcus lichenis]|uniref:Uncharacterized protein n=1 Tax=Paracraurococcus lichenis TaxID=3064888 RepID=A0ABT9E7J6_9PROT|nr:hypothetical protein [Paracraurococcus sp. LOR1-02]MDO9712172.1 hypothetical protein [Paracraurococcus sp. LOR1-02]
MTDTSGDVGGPGTVDPPKEARSVPSEEYRIPGAVSELDPKSKAGVNLAYVVLFLLGSSILLLFGYLLIADLAKISQLKLAYEGVNRTFLTSLPSQDRQRLETFQHQLAVAAAGQGGFNDVEVTAANASLQNAIRSAPALSVPERTALETCLPSVQALVRDPAAGTSVQACLVALESLKRQIDLDPERIRQAVGFATEVNNHWASFHTFWLQAAQLVLLNLLLPLLTGLFGYIFATQQTGAQRSDNG